ncbi:MAG: histidine phosphatase family protein [Coriobacteriaceae bacterium]|nr:histidine phosphatase family protein [Coriobacteriaceae bacterium]
MVLDPHGYISEVRHSQAKILLMRHPQTVANQARRFLGAQNMPLSELGQQQLKQAIEGLVSWQPTEIVSSPLERCLAIAEPVAQRLGLDIKIDERVAEIDFGAAEGLTHQEAMDKGLSLPWGETAAYWPVEGAESIEQFAERLRAAAEDLELRQGKTAVIAHGGVIRGLSSYWLHIPVSRLWNMTVRNVESTLFVNDRDDGITLERFGIKPEWLAGII